MTDPGGTSEVCRVFVTGFAPFLRHVPLNPAHEITQSLPLFLPPTQDRLTSVRILQHPCAIPVSYKAVRGLVPVMLESREGVTDVILHIGVAMGRKTFDLECRANRRGYADAEDMYGETMPDDRCSKDFHDCEETLSTMLDADEILRLWLDDLRTSSGAARQVALGRSDSAGGYICEYMFYNSLAWSARRNLAQRSVAKSERSVLFLHVPARVAQDVEMGRKVTIALLRAIAHSRSTTKRYATLVGA